MAKRRKAKRGRNFLRTKEWRKLRDGTVERDGNRCAICGCDEGLVVHHILYRRGHSQYQAEPSNLITLCKSCHWKVHRLDLGLALFKTLMLSH